jgi:threonine dehydrogenase-like Zn-dependent dehydrogenase
VIALYRRPSALALAETYGVEDAILVEDPAAAIARTRERTGGRMCDRVIGAVGQNWPLEFASSFLAENARLVVAGYHLDGASAGDLRIDNWKNVDVISAHERDPRHFRDVISAGIEAVASGAIDLAPLLTHSYPIERIGEAFEAQTNRPDGFLKAIVQYA